MNKQDYLDSLLNLCSDKNRAIFQRMYPDGPTKSQMARAIDQVERTLRSANNKYEDDNSEKKDLKEANEEMKKEIKKLEREKSEDEREISDLNARMSKLENPVNMDNAKDQERLQFLCALEAAGVDNWEGFEYALETQSEWNEEK